MSIAIAFLSGKGGSGKTTLALSTANLLCKCGVQTLLVDCDLSTNGATYFYESQMTTHNKAGQPNLLSFDSLLNLDGVIDALFPLMIEPGLDFVPSISDISNQHLGNQEKIHNHAQAIRLENFFTWAQKNYEVVLFDCQAGYADFLPMLLPWMDVDLFVMEADSISASAMRSLHLKIGNFLGHARLYQIFNKATLEEFDIYSKIVGTFFTNIGTLLFDWKIRQAFSRSQVPDLEHTSAKYGLDLCEICKIILVDKAIQEILDGFSTQLRHRQLEDEREQIEEELYKVADKPAEKNFLTNIISIVCTELIFVVSILVMSAENLFLKELPDTSLLLVAMVAFIPAMLIFMLGFSRPSHEEQRRYRRRLKEIEKELARPTYFKREKK